MEALDERLFSIERLLFPHLYSVDELPRSSSILDNLQEKISHLSSELAILEELKTMKDKNGSIVTGML